MSKLSMPTQKWSWTKRKNSRKCSKDSERPKRRMKSKKNSRMLLD